MDILLPVLAWKEGSATLFAHTRSVSLVTDRGPLSKRPRVPITVPRLHLGGLGVSSHGKVTSKTFLPQFDHPGVYRNGLLTKGRRGKAPSLVPK